jgi:HD superfamily phosphodiesterase
VAFSVARKLYIPTYNASLKKEKQNMDDCYSRQQLDDLYIRMITYFEGDPKRIAHLTKVHSFARIIGLKEELDEVSLFILEAAAYTHDIGIRPAEKKYGSSDGKLQEQEGPIEAESMLIELGVENYLIDRICYLIGHHHTYDNIDGLDYRILVEADFLVNIYEDDLSDRAIQNAFENIFKTKTGRELCLKMYGGSIDECD